ncbi:GcrA family cell cycle regulator [Bradyrhizobium oropedii]|uniref:GcrA family cell cycle regulator n=1 Tax=Bradyrhizobium oropedii TaxID=1571201 RepID=UPI001E5EF2E2|nr:GcrA family cell cycle regulator [Bradyrhizobium oropedii]
MLGEWTVDRVERLRKLWADGYSASEIANELGNISRSGVLGKVTRLKLPPRYDEAERLQRSINGAARRERQAAIAATPSPEPTPPKNIDPPAPPPRPKPGKIAAVSLVPTYFKKPAQTEQRAPRPHVVADPAALTAKGVKLDELTNITCRWPMGDPHDESFMFCGELSANLEDKRPYCPFHSRRAVDRTGTIRSASVSKHAAAAQ